MSKPIKHTSFAIRCCLCNKQFTTIQSFSNHLGLAHKIDKNHKKDYYDKYMKQENEGTCLKCGKPTHFQSLNKGYTRYCCRSCQVSAQGNASNPIVRQKMQQTMLERYGVKEIFMLDSVKEKSHKKHQTKVKKDIVNISNKEIIKIKEKNKNSENLYSLHCSFRTEQVKQKSKETKLVKYGSATYNNPDKAKETIKHQNEQFEKEHNRTQIGKLIQKYGQGWKSLNLPIIKRGHNAHFVENKYIPEIEQYASQYHNNRCSNKEKDLVNFIKNFYNKPIIENSKHIIAPQELDIYLPDLKIAIEFNGIYWHSTDNGKDKNYHINKSLACRKKNIRLIHIYEFEDFEEQKKLLKSLIEGKDDYPINDFNKNNLLDTIPKPEIIYKDIRYIIYGAGKLY